MNIFFVSLGCDKNLVDSEVMLGLLDAKGYQIVDDETLADVMVINTCCFIHDAKEESINTILQMAEKMSYNPAKIVGLDKGDIAPGKTADIVIFDPNETYKIDKNKFASKGRNTPFDGRTVTGKVKMTIVGGHIVYEE